MNFGEVIQAWKSDCSWINGLPNPYVKRDLDLVMSNPATPGEIFARFSIVDKTVLVNGQVCPFERFYEYHTHRLNGNEEEKEQEAARLRSELLNFTNNAIVERMQQIENMRNAGDEIFTANPYEW